MAETEGGLPEQHPQAAEVSKAAAREEQRRAYQLRRFSDAERLSVPHENLEHPAIHRLVSAARDTDALKNLVFPTGSWLRGVS